MAWPRCGRSRRRFAHAGGNAPRGPGAPSRRLEIGESSVMIAVSSPHRREAFRPATSPSTRSRRRCRCGRRNISRTARCGWDCSRNVTSATSLVGQALATIRRHGAPRRRNGFGGRLGRSGLGGPRSTSSRSWLADSTCGWPSGTCITASGRGGNRCDLARAHADASGSRISSSASVFGARRHGRASRRRRGVSASPRSKPARTPSAPAASPPAIPRTTRRRPCSCASSTAPARAASRASPSRAAD